MVKNLQQNESNSPKFGDGFISLANCSISGPDNQSPWARFVGEQIFYMGVNKELLIQAGMTIAVLNRQFVINEGFGLAVVLHSMRPYVEQARPFQEYTPIQDEENYQDGVVHQPTEDIIHPVETLLNNAANVFLENESDENRVVLENAAYAASIEISANRTDEVANAHLRLMADTLMSADVDDLPSDESGIETLMVKPEIFNIVNTHILEISNRHNVKPVELRNILNILLNGGGAERVPDNLYKAVMDFRIASNDFAAMVEFMQDVDVEGIALNAAQITAELNNADEPDADLWRKAQLVLGFYAPLLELSGVDVLATEAYSSAYRLLFKYKEGLGIVEKAVAVHKAAENECNQEGMNKMVDKIMRVIGGVGVNDIKWRKKSFGSFMAKFERYLSQGKEVNRISIPDAVGVKIVIPDSNNPQDLEVSIKHTKKELGQLIKFLRINGYDIKAPDNEASIEWRGSFKDRDAYFQGIPLRMKPSSNSGYSGVHVTAQKNGVWYEFQMVTRTEDEVNGTTAHHAFYKAKKSFGLLGHMLALKSKEETDPEKRSEYGKLTNKAIIALLSDLKPHVRRFNELKKPNSPIIRENMADVILNYLENINLVDFDSVLDVISNMSRKSRHFPIVETIGHILFPE